VSTIDDKIMVVLDGLEKSNEDQCTKVKKWSNLSWGIFKGKSVGWLRELPDLIAKDFGLGFR
jgi:hypothetical protein